MSNRTQRALTRAAEDRKIQIAAGTLTAAGAALAGKAGVEALRSSGDGSGPSRAYRLKTREKPKQGIRRIARGRAQDALDQLEAAGDEAVHEARKDLKKLRSLLRMVRGGLGKGFYSTENKRFRDAGRRLSAARDAEVKVETLELLQERFSDQLDGVELGTYKKALQDESKAASSEIDPAARPVAESVEAIALGRNRITGWRLKPPGWDLVGPGLIRTYRRGRKGMQRSLADPSGENVHEWRKRAKDLWYQLRILQEAWPELIGPTADQAHGLGDLLGDHHDLEVLVEDIRARRDVAFERRKDAKRLRKLAARRQRELLSKAFDLGERLYAEKPKAFGRRFEAYWLAWRPS
jgi:CHAD domain-containing protein